MRRLLVLLISDGVPYIIVLSLLSLKVVDADAVFKVAAGGVRYISLPLREQGWRMEFHRHFISDLSFLSASSVTSLRAFIFSSYNRLLRAIFQSDNIGR